MRDRTRKSLSLNWILLLVVGLGLQGCYVVGLALRQNNLFNSRRSIPEVLAEGNLDPKLREKLGQVQEVVGFARKAGLTVEDAYHYFIEMEGDAVSYTITVAHPDKLELVTWWFPIVGTVPYRGYFDVADRDEVAEDYERQGFDVYRGKVGAFSSLGWFADPIYESMLDRPIESLAHLLFHELTHRTFWVSDEAGFNENLAEFVAGRLTREFLLATGRQDSVEPYETRLADKAKYRAWLGELRSTLGEFFDKSKVVSSEERIRGRNEIFEEFQKEKRPKFARYDYVGKKSWNNARVLASTLYNRSTEAFDEAYDCCLARSDADGVTMGAFLGRMEVVVDDSNEDPMAALKLMCTD